MNEFFSQNGKFTKTSELEGLSKQAQLLANSIVRNHEVLSAKEHECKSIIFDIKINIFKIIKSLTSNCWKVIGIMILTLVLLAGCSYFAYCILSTLYKDIHQLFYWSVKYSFAKNVNIMYTLSALFSAFSLYVWISILGIKKFFGTIFDKISNKIIDKVESKI